MPLISNNPIINGKSSANRRCAPPTQAPLLEGTDWIGCGSGFDQFTEQLSECYQEQLKNIVHGIHPRAKEIAQLAASKFTHSHFITDPMNAAPVYLRNKVALKEKER